MTPRRPHMIAALQLRGQGERTQEAYGREGRLLAQFYHTSPDRLSAEDLPPDVLHRPNVAGLAPASRRIGYRGLRFFSHPVLQRAWSTLSLLRAHTTHRLPAVLRVEEVQRLLASAPPWHTQVSCTTVSSLGRRLHEALFLQGADIDGPRLQGHIHRGKGATDRYVPLPEETLALRHHDALAPPHPPGAGRGLGASPRPQARAPAMTTLREICTALAPAYRARYPHLPTAPRQGISAIPNCRSGSYGYRLSQGPPWAGQHRLPPSCGNRHCPQGQQQQTPQGFQPHLDQQRPGPHFLMTLTVPELLRPLIRSPQRLAYHALFQAAAAALTRLAQDERFIETALPGGTGGLPTWGRPLQSHPPIHSSVPGGGLAKDHTTWGPSRAHFFGPVPALSPISRALFKEARRRAGVLEQSDPQGWTRPWHVQSQAPHHSHSAFTALAPSVFRGALANRRIVGLKDRTGTFTYRPVGRTRPPPAARCPTWGAPMRVVLRLWPSSRAFVETR